MRIPVCTFMKHKDKGDISLKQVREYAINVYSKTNNILVF